jgi:hypothetical protein
LKGVWKAVRNEGAGLESALEMEIEGKRDSKISDGIRDVMYTLSCDCLLQDVAPHCRRVLRGVEHLVPYSLGPGMS